ncbi:protein-associating with the carboxyl-terminal domain of ezrin [Culicoides brevitarsis]|uniref:protein-associating with the carboxyl-terminal domain of ezrin n=1 Tax=Culicoides brevitarsis TaxID=469753 RepID=UPI00307BB610
MGNETSSQLKGLVIDKKAIEVTDFYSLNLGQLPPSSPPTSANKKSGSNKGGSASPGGSTTEKVEKELLAIFQNDDPLQTNFLVDGQNPLTRAIHNIKIYRHPNILKYVAAWTVGTNAFLATENCKPLSAVLSGLNDIQICIGLKSILGAVAFLVEQAKARHLNICISSIYVNDEGQWKLFGFEHVWKSSDLSQTIIDKSVTYRYKKAVGKDEIKTGFLGIEQFAFAVLCDDLLKQTKGSIPHIEEFREYCLKHLKHEDVNFRPSLSAILLHPYFNHDFILIHSYLTELPLKSHESKQEFFSNLIDRLRVFDEEIVASQLSGLLLSRLVLLDMTAKNCFIPFLLKPKNLDDIPQQESLIVAGPGLFSTEIFQKYLIPRIKQAFAIKDSQIRIALLEYFPSYVEMFAKDDLKNDILPQLLLGIKDTNDFLVSRTLLCMADLVPILGATQVIGGNRTKIFSDGRPQGPETQIVKSRTEPRSITPVITSAEHLMTSESPIPEPVDVSGSFTLPQNVNGDPENSSQAIETDVSLNLEETQESMPERLTPEGEEMEPVDATNENEDWSDWENPTHSIPETHSSQITEEIVANEVFEAPQVREIAKTRTAIKTDNIDELDIKNQIFRKVEEPEEFDFFKDMEPVIKSASVTLFEKEATKVSPKQETASTRLNIATENVASEDGGWGDDDAWGE